MKIMSIHPDADVPLHEAAAASAAVLLVTLRSSFKIDDHKRFLKLFGAALRTLGNRPVSNPSLMHAAAIQAATTASANLQAIGRRASVDKFLALVKKELEHAVSVLSLAAKFAGSAPNDPEGLMKYVQENGWLN